MKLTTYDKFMVVISVAALGYAVLCILVAWHFVAKFW